MLPLRRSKLGANRALLGHLEVDNQPLSALTRHIGAERNTIEVCIECAVVVVIILQGASNDCVYVITNSIIAEIGIIIKYYEMSL